MERIKSFTINHNILTPGFYISRVDDGDIITYDLRTRKPNAGDYMDNATMHSVEHMIATYMQIAPRLLLLKCRVLNDSRNNMIIV